MSDRDTRAVEATERLAAASIDATSASEDELVKAATAAELVREAIVVLELRGTAEAAEALATLEGAARERGDKDTRRDAKRALYRLEQKGVELPRSEPESRGRRPVGASTGPVGHLTPFDGFGRRLAWIHRPRSGGILMLNGVVHEPFGLEQFTSAHMPRGKFSELLREVVREHGVTLVETPWRYVDNILREGFERARTRGTKIRGGDYSNGRLSLMEDASPPQPAPVTTLLDADEVRADRGALAASASLLEEPELGRWVLAPHELRPHVERLRSLAPNPDTTPERSAIEEVRREALAAAFTGDGGRSWQRRLEETAWVLGQTGRVDSARRAYAASLALETSDRGGLGIPFAEALVERSLALVLEARAVESTPQREG